ncbi:MAG: sigma-54-dependent Fis family transcriptional regulator [Chitinophagaceae bacterium]|nr:sigma-54-dependent Fis family transcriptional regulator [Chitinophagaceae bacterium]
MLLKNASILVVDDDPDVLTAVRLLLKTRVKEVVTEKNPDNILPLLSENKFDLVLLDMNYRSALNTGNEGVYWLSRILSFRPQLPVIMITAYGDIDLAITSLKKGAVDFVVKPWQNNKLISVIEEALKTHKKKEKRSGRDELIGESDLMCELFHKIEKIAPTDANILILGENGTGKDLVAKSIHQHSLRNGYPYIKVDVGALTDTLFESELFGHKKGAFTDAREDREGRIIAANHGTLFLDEIGNISLQQQAKLLSVLQNRQVTKLGSNEPVAVDIRLLCATNAPLQELANENRFRKDLIYRINTVELIIPPLRKRGNDIILLAERFIKMYAEKYSKYTLELGDSAREKLKHYPFPGNVRELQYIIERAVVMSEQLVLESKDIVFSPIESRPAVEDDLNLNAVEKNAILRVIEKHNGNISRAAKELGITRTSLYRRLSKHDI